ncbi:sulfatase-like hydrolase/transferase [Streptomyces sp. NBC_00435]|uniref:sulfatase-like hydrolase/transferase n=1 Tax=Streptomyces sp. NBC_00435 TaxID=2903649 RepID=UPI002E1CFB5A
MGRRRRGLPPTAPCLSRSDEGPALPTRFPNVIVVLTDQRRWETTGVHGDPADVTPEFDRIARAGTHVEQALTPQPVCAPARAALQTGPCCTTRTAKRCASSGSARTR